MVFYFSGHGSQQPDENGDEQGGNDEIVLPYDVAKWEGHGIKNALVDDELDLRVRKLLDKGVDFFGIIDACHSATGFRAVEDDDTRSREIDPQDLGVPASALASETPGNLLKDLAADKPGRGRAAYFYAAQESEVALEKVPKGAEPGQSFGVFTYNLLRRLNENPDVTYRTLHQAVIDSIKRGSLMATQTPELEGAAARRAGAAADRRQAAAAVADLCRQIAGRRAQRLEQRHHRRRSTTTRPTPTTRCWPMARSRQPARRRAASRRSPTRAACR